ncbi:MAG: hypothetical protein RLZZ548_1239, partial [Bacteroidota bacterium]
DIWRGEIEQKKIEQKKSKMPFRGVHESVVASKWCINESLNDA